MQHTGREVPSLKLYTNEAQIETSPIVEYKATHMRLRHSTQIGIAQLLLLV